MRKARVLTVADVLSDSGKARLRALVQDRVQGVFFRDFTQEHAHRLSLTGWVRNLPDGSTVEVVAEGTRAQLSGFLDLLRRGPPGAYVATLEAEWSEWSGEYPRFGVR